jgi:acyl-CoA thioester hydrolase
VSSYRPFVRPVRVPYAYTDAQGRVFYASYFLIADEARYAFWEEGLGLGEKGVVEIEHAFFVVHMECDYHGAAEFYDILDVTVEPRDLGRSSLRLDYGIAKSRGGERVFNASTVIVWADQASGRPAPWPAHVRDALVAHRGPEVLKS